MAKEVDSFWFSNEIVQNFSFIWGVTLISVEGTRFLRQLFTFFCTTKMRRNMSVNNMWAEARHG